MGIHPGIGNKFLQDSNRLVTTSMFLAVYIMPGDFMVYPVGPVWYIFHQIRLDALRQNPLLYIIDTLRTGGGSPTTSKQLW